jgi:hypothetical protein
LIERIGAWGLMVKHEDDDLILIQVHSRKLIASSYKGCSSLHGPKAIFTLKILKNHEFQGLRVSDSEQVQTNFELIQSCCRKLRKSAEHLCRDF